MGRRLAAVLVTLVGLVVAGMSVEFGIGWDSPGLWLPDVLTGLAFIGAGIFLVSARPGLAALLLATGFTWFVGSVWPAAVFLHRGPLIHLLLTAPRATPPRRWHWGMVAAGYAAAAPVPVWGSDPLSMLLGTVLAAVLVSAAMRSPGRSTVERHLLVGLVVALASVLVVGAGLRLVLPSDRLASLVLLAYDAVLVAIAASVAVLYRPAGRGEVMDLVVELGEHPLEGLRDRLALALGDPSLQLGFRHPSGAYRDEAGRPLELCEDWSQQVTYIQRVGRPYAVLLHDPSTLEDTETRDAVEAAVRLLATNGVLHADLEAEVRELEASRRRLLLTTEEEYRQLERELRSGVGRRVDQVSALLRHPDVSSLLFGEHLERARRHVEDTRVDLARLAHGLRPADLDHGLGPALSLLAARSPVPTELAWDGDTGRVSDPTAAIAYFACSEGLANVAKHSGATRVSVSLHLGAEELRLTVSDNGHGLASASGGSGLQNLKDRVQEAGGALDQQSGPGGGTRLTVTLPLHAGRAG